MSLTSALEPHTAQITALGILFEDSVGGPPTIEIAAGYNADLAAFEFYADVDQVTVPLYPNGDLPQITVIDTASMEIVHKAVAYDEAELLAIANAL